MESSSLTESHHAAAPQQSIQLHTKEAAPASEGGDDYDPHLHRDLENPTNNFETLVHLIKCSLGTGILAMPQAFARAGVISGTCGTVLLAVIITYSLHILLKSQYWACKKARVGYLSYPLVMNACLQAGPKAARSVARASSYTVDVFVVFYQLGICCVYIVFIADNLKKVIDPVWEAHTIIHMLIILLPLMGLNLIRNLKRLAPLSTLANVLTLAGLAIVVYYLVAEPRIRTHDLSMWGHLTAYPLFFGTVLFALTAVGVVVALENNMKTPKAFVSPCGVLNSGMAFITGLYLALGLAGYVYCGEACSDSITLDLPVKRDWLANAAIGLLTISIFISYGLHCFVPVDVVWRTYLLPCLERKGSQRLLLWEYVLRIGICFFTFVVAASVPLLGLFISLCGALCLSALGICFPSLMEFCGPGGDGKHTLRRVVDVLLFIVGIVGLVAGTYTALISIIHELTTKPPVVTQTS